MPLKFDTEKPFYVQLTEKIEDDILEGVLEEEKQMPSVSEISAKTKISCTTVQKGLDPLVRAGVLYKKRGIGKFVSPGSRQKIVEKRRKTFFQNYVVKLLEEAQRLNISKQEILSMIERASREPD